MQDKKHIEQLFLQHYAAMYRLALLILHDAEESKDVVSEVFEQVLGSQMAVRPETAGAFLLRSVRNRCLNAIDRRRLQDQLRQLYARHLAETDEPLQAVEERLHRLRQCIDHDLPPQARRVLLMRYQEGLSYAEVARQLDISEAMVYKHLRNAFNHIKVKLNNRDDDGKE